MKTVAIDFDGVIHRYSKGWQYGSIYDENVQRVFETIDKLFSAGYSVFIFSTRCPRQIKHWLVRQIMESDYVIDGMGNDPNEWVHMKFTYTCAIIPFWKRFWNKERVIGITRRKLPAMVYVDDRALKFEGNWDQTFYDIENFKTYQDRQ